MSCAKWVVAGGHGSQAVFHVEQPGACWTGRHKVLSPRRPAAVAWARQRQPRPDPPRMFHVERSPGGSRFLGGPGADGSHGSGLLMNEFDAPALHIRLLPTGRRGETPGSHP